MTCHDVLDRIEALVAGDEAATPEFRAHLEGCLACAAALAAAQRIEAALAARPAPGAPPRFTIAVASRIRQERWRSEEQVDRLFNVALAVGIVLVVGGVAALFNLQTLASGVVGGLALFNRATGEMIVRAAPVVRTYVIAVAFLATMLVVWWWAERRLSL